MKKNTKYNLRYRVYLYDITDKRINLLMTVSIFLLLLLMYLDFSVRNSVTAIYTRMPSLIIAVIILLLKNLKKSSSKQVIAVLYNLFLFTILAMMYAKFLLHLNTGTDNLNTLSIVTAIFIISLEIRARYIYAAFIYFGTLIFFIIILRSFFSFNNEITVPLYNVLIMNIVGFVINVIQNSLRYKNFENKYLLDLEKKKLVEKNKELEEKNKDLEKFNVLFVNREFRIKELRDQVKELEEKLKKVKR